MRFRRFWVSVSFLLIAAGFGWWLFGPPPRLGIELAGGCQLTLRFAAPPDLDGVRAALARDGLDGQIQALGPRQDATLLVRVGAGTIPADQAEGRLRHSLDRYLQPELDPRRDVNRLGTAAVTELLRSAGVSEGDAADAAAAVAEIRRDRGVVADWQEVTAAGDVSAGAAAALRQEAQLGSYSVLAVDAISPQVASELSHRGALAVTLALLAMLVYVWIRFELPFGIGAVMASIHDVLVAMGLFLALRFEINLTTVAALLTLVGYSVNDTVVVFDRVRENRRRLTGMNLEELINLSLNQTLSRTLITSGTTLLAAVPLLVFGGPVLRGFAFLIVVGVVVGTYSTIYVAGPFALLWHRLKERRRPPAAQGPAGVGDALPPQSPPLLPAPAPR